MKGWRFNSVVFKFSQTEVNIWFVWRGEVWMGMNQQFDLSNGTGGEAEEKLHLSSFIFCLLKVWYAYAPPLLGLGEVCHARPEQSNYIQITFAWGQEGGGDIKKPPERSLALPSGSGFSSGRCHLVAYWSLHSPASWSSVSALHLPQVSELFLNLNCQWKKYSQAICLDI